MGNYFWDSCQQYNWTAGSGKRMLTDVCKSSYISSETYLLLESDNICNVESLPDKMCTNSLNAQICQIRLTI